MSKLRLSSIEEYHHQLSTHTIGLRGRPNTHYDVYLVKYGIHHILYFKRQEEVFKLFLRLDFLASYLSLWDTFTTPLKVCRIIGIEKYLDAASTHYEKQAATTDNIQYLIAVLNFLYRARLIMKASLGMFELCLKWCKALNVSPSLFISTYRLLGAAYRLCEYYDKSQEFLLKCIEVCKENTLYEMSDYLEARNELSILLQRVGRFEEGRDLMQTVYDDACKHVGPFSEIALSARLSLAWFLQQAGLLQRAEALNKAVLKDIEDNLGLNQPLRYAAIWQYNGILKELGKVKEVYQFIKGLCLEVKQEFGKQYFIYRQFENERGLCCIELGNYEEAEAVFSELISIVEEMNLVPEGMYFVNLSAAFMFLNKLDEAERSLERAKEQAKASWPSDSPNYLMLELNLARLYMEQERPHEAIEILFKLLEKQKNKYGVIHPHVFSSLSSLAHLHSCINDSEASLRFYKEAYDVGKEALGICHPWMSTVIINLTRFYDADEQYDEKERLLDEACQIIIDDPNEQNQATLYHLYLLAHLKLSLEKNAEALSLFQTLLDGENRVYGENSQDTAITHYSLATCYSRLHQYDLAIQHRKTCFEIEVRFEGLGVDTTLMSALQLVRDHLDAEETDEAMRLMKQVESAYKEIAEPIEGLNKKIEEVRKEIDNFKA